MWVDTKTAARLCGISKRAVRKNARNGNYKIKYEEGRGRGGQILKISVPSLPPEAQARYFDKLQPTQTGVKLPYTAADFASWARDVGVKKKEMLDKAKELINRLQAEQDLGKTEATKQACKMVDKLYPEQGFSVKSYYKWENDYQEEGIVGLMDKRGLRNNDDQKNSDKPPKVDEEAWKFFLKLYLSENKPAVKFCYEVMKLKAEEEGWQITSRRSFNRYVKKYIDPYLKAIKREGKKYAKDNFERYIQRDVISLESNEVWVGDHHNFDIFVLDKDGNIKTPWISAWMDARSRLFTGYHISFNPNLDTIKSSFIKGAREYGLPQNIYLDNGKDYRAYEFAGGKKRRFKKDIDINPKQVTSMVDKLDVSVTFANEYNARAKVIERHFRTFKEHFARLFPAYRGGSTEERPESLPDILKDKSNLVTIDEFKEKFTQWLDVVHHETGQTGQGMNGKTPKYVFKENLEEKRMLSKKDMMFLMTKVEGTRVVGRNGIRLNNTHYTSEDLEEKTKKGDEVIIRYNPDNIGEIIVCDLGDRILCKAYALEDAAYLGANEKVFKDYQKHCKKLRQVEKDHDDYVSDVQIPSFEEYIELKEKANQRRKAKQEQPEETNVVRLHKTDNYEAIKNMMESEIQDLPAEDQEESRKKEQQEMADLLEFSKQLYGKDQQLDPEEQKKKDLEMFKKALGSD